MHIIKMCNFITLLISVAKTFGETLKTCLIGVDILDQPRMCVYMVQMWDITRL